MRTGWILTSIIVPLVILSNALTSTAFAPHPIEQPAICLQPPSGVDLSTLSDAQLRSYALPSRPHNTAEMANWMTLLAHSKHRVCTTVQDKLSTQVNNSVQPLYASQETSPTWAGVVATGYGYQRVVATWTVPNLATSTSSIAFWVGMGGDGYDGGGWLVQAGIQGSYCSSCRPQMQYNGFWEDILDSNHKYGPETPSGLTINALDSVEAIADSNYSFPGQVYFYIGDATTNTYWGNAYSYPASNGSTAEWITERQGSQLTQFSLPACPSGSPYCDTFSDDYVIRNGGMVYLNSLPTNAVVMNPSGTQLAYPGPIHNTGSSVFFNTYWQHS